MNRDELVDRVLVQMEDDIAAGDFTAIEELLSTIPDRMLEAYLPEEDRE